MKFILSIALVVLSYSYSFSQTNWHIGTYNPDSVNKFTHLGSNHSAIKFVYKIPNTLLLSFLDRDKALEFVKKTTPFDTLCFNTRLDSVLPEGNYIVESVKNEWVHYDYEHVSKNKIRIYQYKGKHFVMMITDSLGSVLPSGRIFLNGKIEIKYNKDIEGFIIRCPKDYDIYLIKVDNQMILLELSGEKSLYDFYEYNYRNFHKNGFLVTDKPIYRIGDTLHFKAYIYDKKGKKINKPLKLKINHLYNNESYINKDISPMSQGVFIGSITITDTFDLDNKYSLIIDEGNKQKGIYVSQSFKVEDYQLDKYTLFAQLDKDELFNTGEIELKIQAKDFNHNIIMDGRYEMIITANNINFYDSLNHFIPNILIKKTGALLSYQPTIIKIKASDLLNADAAYSVGLKVWNSANEIHSDNLYFNNSLSPKIEIKYKSDTIIYEVHNNNYWKLSLEYEDEYDFETITKKLIKDSGSIVIDYSSPLPKFVLSKDNKTVEKEIDYNYNKPHISTYRNGEKLFIQTYNSKSIHIKLQIYEREKLIYQKAVTRLDTVINTDENKDIFVHISYYWDGEPESMEYKLKPNLNNYKVEIELSDTVYPGEETTLKVKVSDYSGNAIQGANITAFAVNSEFMYDIHYINFSTNSIVENIEDNSWNFDIDFPMYFINRFNNNYRKKFNISESQLNYQMRFPKNGLFINEFEEQRDNNYSCHFAPFLLRGGSIQPIYYVLIDNVPVYLANDDSRAWSFRFVSGVHSIKIRSLDKIYLINNVHLKSGGKTELFLDINNVPDSVIIKDISKKLTKDEIKMFQYYTKAFKFDNYKNTVIQNNTVYSDRRNNRFSPFYNEKFMYLGNKPIIFNATKNYNSYTFNNDMVYTDNKKIIIQNKLNNYALKNHKFGEFSNKVFIDDNILIEKPIILDFSNKINSKTKAKIILNTDSISFDNIFLVNLDSGNIIENNFYEYPDGYYQPRKVNVNSGNYRIIAFTKNNNILVYNTLVKVGGLNYIKLSNNYSQYISFNSLGIDKKDSIVWSLFYGNKIKYKKHKTFSTIEYNSSIKKKKSEVKFYIIDKSKRTIISRKVFYYNIDSTVSETNKVYFDNYIPKTDSTYTVIVNKSNYKPKKLTINPEKLGADVILIYLEEEKNPLNLFTNKKRTNYIVSRAYPPYYAAKHGTVLCLGDEEVVAYNIPLIDRDQSSTGVGFRGARTCGNLTVRMTGQEIQKMQARSAAVAITVGGVISSSYGTLVGVNNESTSSEYGEIANIFKLIGRSNFSDVGFWVPNIVTDENGEAEVSVTFPDNITNWTAQIIAAGDKKKVGVAVKTIISTKNQLARIETPRFLTQGDSCLINTKLINYDTKSLLLTDFFKVNGVIQASQKLELDSFVTKHHLLIADSVSKVVEYGFVADGGIQDAEKRVIGVVPLGSWHSEGEFFILDGDTSISIKAQDKDVKFIVYKDLLQVMLNDIKQIELYTYDCNEQKASKLIALLLKENIYNYLGIKFKDKRKIKRLIKYLEENITYPLNWGWWPDNKPVDWISDHVVHALVMANNHNYKTNLNYNYYDFNDIRFDNAQMRYIRSKMNKWKQNPESINWNKKFKSVEDQLWNLKAKKSYNMQVKVEEVLAFSHSTIKGGLYWGNNDYSHTENKIICTSLAFELIYKIDSTNAALDKILLYLLSHHGFNKINTYEAAFMTNAIVPYLLNSNSKLPKSSISDNSGNELAFNQQRIIKAGNSYTLIKKGNSKVFAVQYSQYFDKQPNKVDSLFKVQVQYFIDDSLVSSFTSGDQIIMKLKINAKRHADYTMIEVPLPASCTYSNDAVIESSVEVHREKYREKLNIYCESLAEGETEFSVKLQARFSGTFYMNPVTVKEMYYPFFFGRNGINRVKVGKK